MVVKKKNDLRLAKAESNNEESKWDVEKAAYLWLLPHQRMTLSFMTTISCRVDICDSREST